MNVLPLLLVTVQAVQEPAPPEERGPQHTELPETPVVVEADITRGWAVVPVMVNGRGPYSMILDTGAMGTALDASLAAELGLPVIGKTRLGDPSNPEAHEVDRVAIESLAVGDAFFEGLEGVAWERPVGMRTPGIVGILGLPTFQDCLLTIDRGRSQVRIENGALPEPDGSLVVPLDRDAFGVPQLPIDVAGHRVVAHLDSGNMGDVTLPKRLEDELPLAEGSKKTVNGMRASGPVELTTARLEGRITIGGRVLENPEVKFDATLAHANLGKTFFDACVPTLDLANGRLRLAPPAGEEATAAAAPRRRLEQRGGRRMLGVEMQFAGSAEMWVSRVVPGSLAEKAGVKADDLLLEVDGEAVSHHDPQPLTDALSRPGAFTLTVKRAGERLELDVPAAEKAGEGSSVKQVPSTEPGWSRAVAVR